MKHLPEFRDSVPAARSSPGTRALFFSLFPSIMLPMFIAVADQTIVAAALPAIAGELGSVERVSWVVVCYLIATTIAAPVYGRMADSFGVKRLMVLALGIFMAASLCCALSRSVELLAAARVLQGLGGGGLITLSQALIGATIAPRERGRYQGYLAAVASTASAVGPVAGGFLTQHFGWQAVFLVNLPLGLMAILLTLRLPVRTLSPGGGSFDFPGLVLLSSFVVCVIIALEQWQRLDPQAPGLYGLIAASLVFLAALIWHERRAVNALFPAALFRNPSIWRSNLLAMVHGAMLVALISYLPIFLRVTYGGTASEIGLLLLPMTAGVGIGSIITGRIVSRFGRTALMPSLGLIVVLAALLVLAFFSHHFSAVELSILVAVTTAFMGTVMAVVQITVQVAAGPGLLGTAAASVQFSKSLGSALGVAIVGGVVFAALAATSSEAAGQFASVLQHGPDALSGLPADAEQAVRSSISSAFRYGFLTIAVFAAIANALAWSIPIRRI